MRSCVEKGVNNESDVISASKEPRLSAVWLSKERLLALQLLILYSADHSFRMVNILIIVWVHDGAIMIEERVCYLQPQ